VKRAYEETAFLFTCDVLASVSRPMLELKGSARIALQPGETRVATVSLRAAELRFTGPT
jgi:beta-glucosidase